MGWIVFLWLGCSQDNADLMVDVAVAPEFSAEYGDATGSIQIWSRRRQAVDGLWDEQPLAILGVLTPGEPLALQLAGGPTDLVAEGDLSLHPPCEDADTEPQTSCTPSPWLGDVALVVTGRDWEYPSDPEIEVYGQEIAAGSETPVTIEISASCTCDD